VSRGIEGRGGGVEVTGELVGSVAGGREVGDWVVWDTRVGCVDGGEVGGSIEGLKDEKSG